MGSTSGRGIFRGEPGERTRPLVGVQGVELTRECGGDPVSEDGAIVIIAARGIIIMTCETTTQKREH